MAKKDITRLIERLEAFEERAGVRLEALSAFVYKYEDLQGEIEFQVVLRGEIHARNGTQIPSDVLLRVREIIT